MLKIKQNNAINSILISIGKLNDYRVNQWNEKVVETDKGDLVISILDEEIDTIKKKLRYSNVSKLFLYICYRITREHQRTISLDINELIKLKGQKRHIRIVSTLLEDLRLLGDINLRNFEANVDGQLQGLEDSPIITCDNWEQINDTPLKLFTITAGAWANYLLNSDQFAFIPEELFSFKKLKFIIAHNVLMRCRYQRNKIARRNKTKFNLSVNYLLKGTNINVRKYGSSKVVSLIESILNELQQANWYTWSYQRGNKENLPGRDRLHVYKEFMVEFDVKDSRLGDVYDLG